MNYAQSKKQAAEPFQVERDNGKLPARMYSGSVLATPNAALAQRLTREIEKRTGGNRITTADTSLRLRELLKTSPPASIFLDSDLLGGLSLPETVRELSAVAPVVLLGSVSSQADVARLVFEDQVDFVARIGDFVPLISALVGRRLTRSIASKANWKVPCGQTPSEIGEIFRHEINNPLTGILGNAELVLAHHEGFSSLEMQRLQAIVDLAVRLRESIRRISNGWEHPEASLHDPA